MATLRASVMACLVPNHLLKARAPFGLQVRHHEVTLFDKEQMELLLEALAGHETAAKKDLKLVLTCRHGPLRG